MSLPSPCTLAAANAEYDRTVGYRSDLSGQMAQDFLTVCEWLTGRRAESSETAMRSDARFSTTYSNLEDQINRCLRFIATLQNTSANEAARIQAGLSTLPSQYGLYNARGNY